MLTVHKMQKHFYVPVMTNEKIRLKRDCASQASLGTKATEHFEKRR